MIKFIGGLRWGNAFWSLGSTVEDQYNNISKTSFGADTTDTSAFFTGKPYLEIFSSDYLRAKADIKKILHH